MPHCSRVLIIAVVLISLLYANAGAAAEQGQTYSQAPEVVTSVNPGETRRRPLSRSRSIWDSTAGRRPTGSGGPTTTAGIF